MPSDRVFTAMLTHPSFWTELNNSLKAKVFLLTEHSLSRMLHERPKSLLNTVIWYPEKDRISRKLWMFFKLDD